MKRTFCALFISFICNSFVYTQTLELCDYHRPDVDVGILAVFPRNPLKTGKKCTPIYDILLDENGGVIFANALYSPNEHFDKAFYFTLGHRTFHGATEEGLPAPSIFREIVYSYFYVEKLNAKGSLTQAPISLEVVDSTFYKMMETNNVPLEILLKVDENGVLTDYIPQKTVARALAKGLYGNKIGKKIFEPAKVNGEGVASEIMLVLGNEEDLPKSVRKMIDNQESSLVSPRTGTAKNMSLKMGFDRFGYMKSIVVAEADPMNATELWSVLDSLCYMQRKETDHIAYEDYGFAVGIDSHDLSVYQRNIVDRSYHESSHNSIFIHRKDRKTDGYNEDLLELSLKTGETAKIANLVPQDFYYPKVKKKERVEYPLELEKKRMDGYALIDLYIGKGGIPFKAEVYQATHPLFGEAACECYLKWRYFPAKYNGQSVESHLRFRVNFITNNHSLF